MTLESRLAARRLIATSLILLVFAAAAYGARRVTFGSRPVQVDVRWAATVGEAIRERTETRHGLRRGVMTGDRTWGYALTDLSRANIRALILDPAVEDTQHINRPEFRIEPSEPRLPYATALTGWMAQGLNFLSVLFLFGGVVGMILALLEVRVPTGVRGPVLALKAAFLDPRTVFPRLVRQLASYRSGRPRRATGVALPAIVAMALVIVRTAWVSDDAYFTFRTIDNFLHGYGLRWNVAERVQVYTHPLWMLIQIPLDWLSGSAYFTTIALSIGLSLVTVWLLARYASTTAGAFLAIGALLFSSAYVDFSTSGLENPLSHLLLVLFALAFISRARLIWLATCTALLLLTRLDFAVLVGPALAIAMSQSRERSRYRDLAVGLTPFFVWTLFATIYYGFPVPNTAFAKLNTGIPQSETIQQGMVYLIDAMTRDPVLAFMIVLGMGVAVRDKLLAIAVGMVLYVGYVVYVGGDFMSGRFLTPVAAVAAVMIANTRAWLNETSVWAPAAAVLFFGLVAAPNPAVNVEATGIVDERILYFRTNGLMHYSREANWPTHDAAQRGRRARSEDNTRVIVFCCNGMLGYFAGPEVHIIDSMALGDPLLSRLPANKTWRIGHFQREVPTGYEATIASGENLIADPAIASLYDQQVLITRGPIWTLARWRAILNANVWPWGRGVASSNPAIPAN